MTAPLDALGAELGSIAAGIERGLRLEVSVLLAEVRSELAQLRAARAEGELHLSATIAARLAELHDGPPGPAGPPGPPPDEAILVRLVDVAVGRLPAPERGPAGPTGILPAITEWQEGVCYEGAVVTHQGQTWQAKRDTGRAPPHDDWICVAAAGRDGDPGRSFAVRNTWNPRETYKALDVVAQDGASFVARCDDPGPCPGEGWQMIARQGRPGKPGERGDRGPPGRTLVAAEVDGDGVLTLTHDDGSKITCDFYPVLARLR